MRSSQLLDMYTMGPGTLAGVYFFYTCIIIIGSAMNLFVIYHMQKLRRRDKEQVMTVDARANNILKIMRD